MRGAFARLALCLALAAPLGALSFDPMLDLSLGSQYSAFQGGFGSMNYPGRALFIPMIGLGKNDLLAPVLMVDAKYRERPLAEDAEPFVSRWTFLAKPTYKHRFAGTPFDASLAATAKRTVTHDEFKRPWSKGLYDYEEFGAGAKAGCKGLLFLKDASLGLSWAHKGYINQRNPAPTGSKNYYTKDLDILKLDLDADLPAALGLESSLAYSLSFRNYTDSYVLQSDGQINPSQLRAEQLHLVRAGVKGALSATLAWGADLEFMLNASNHNEFDLQAPLFKKDAASFHSVALAPSVTWLPEKDPKGHSLLLGYRGLNRAYTAKPIRNSDGAYTKGAQADTEHSFLLKGTWANLGVKGLGLFALADYAVARSNQAYESAGFRFSYDLFAAQLGLEYRL